MIIVIVDRSGCISCGECWGRCPEFFMEDPEDGLSSIRDRHRIAGKPDEGKASDQLEGCLRGAEEACPADVIRVSPVQPSFD